MKAEILIINNIHQHSNANNVAITKVYGNQIIVGKETKVGDIIIYFPEGSQLSEQFCFENNLFSDPELNKNKTKKGYFSKNRRVKAQVFRGERSEGFIATPEMFSFIKEKSFFEKNISLSFDSLDGINICRRYVPIKTVSLQSENDIKDKRKLKKAISLKMKHVARFFLRHYDTGHLAKEGGRLLNWSNYNKAIVTEKLHGTSGRFGYFPIPRFPKFPKWILDILLFFNIPILKYESFAGSRNINFDLSKDNLYTQVVRKLESTIKGFKLPKDKYYGIQIYFEIIGPLAKMGSYPIKELKGVKNFNILKNQIGETINFDYPSLLKNNDFNVYFYRVESMEFDKYGNYKEETRVEYPFLKIPSNVRVPVLGEIDITLTLTKEDLIQKAEEFIDQRQSIVPYLVEGVCFRGVNTEDDISDNHYCVLKHKSFAFKVGEGICEVDDAIN